MFFIFTAGFFGSFGAAFLKAGAAHVKLELAALATNWRLMAGIAAYLLSSVFFVRGMSAGELSVLYPMVALGYLWTMLWSKLFFGEQFTAAKFGGLLLIFGGLACLGLSAQH